MNVGKDLLWGSVLGFCLGARERQRESERVLSGGAGYLENVCWYMHSLDHDVVVGFKRDFESYRFLCGTLLGVEDGQFLPQGQASKKLP